MASPPASPEPAETANQLKVTDLADVLQLLSRHDFSGVNYYTLGLYLGLSPATLAIITRDNKGDTKSCLRECLTKWLQKDDGVQKKGGPTISSLVSALRELGENAVADGIDMEKHPACKILADHACTSNKFLIAALPQLTALLHSEELIKEIAHTEKDGETLMIEILKAVCLDFKKLEKFAAILIKKKATMEIGNAIEREYRKVYYHHKGNDDLAKDKIHLPPSLTSKFKSMQVQLGSTFDRVELIIKECPPSTLKKIKNILIYCSEDLKPQVAQCDNIHDILKLVRKDCSLDDIEMLKAIVNELNIESAKVVIQEYSDALEKFSETELSKCLNEKFSYASPLQCERITIVVDQNTDDCTLHDIRRLAANTFHKLSPQNSRSVKLNVIRDDNSFTITYSFPLILSEQLIVAARNNIDVLKKNKVKRLTIGYCTVYEATETVDTPTLSYEKQLLSISSGLSKQLILSLSVQLINSTEEVTTLNEELKNKMQSVKTMENEISKQKSDETGQLLHQKVTESETDDASNLAKNLLTTESSQFTQEAFGTSFESATTKVHLEHEALWCNGL
ncbi:PREDICTED: uncharacterized protein LOC109590542, partial [Amphimedon queenslandica]|uniref:Death domain-containing protein n=1 Tax=Amphimedon queenslandica TaxID=400682 RepID=A0AAN0JY20_AMPQE